MTDKEFNVNDISINDLDKIAEIWLETLPDNFKAIIGRKIIINYINEILKSSIFLKKGIYKSNKLLGFVFFGNDDDIIKKLFLRNFTYIIFCFLKDLLKLKFKKMSCYVDVSIYLIVNFLKKRKVENSSELLIIAISKNKQNNNLGSRLITESLKDNYFAQINKISVVTLKSAKENINFYEKNNFKIIDNIYGRVLLELSF